MQSEIREKFHKMLDRAMDETPEGESFLPTFVAAFLRNLEEVQNQVDN